MADYPNNSHSAREKAGSVGATPVKKQMEKVVSGAAKTRKKSEARKFLNFFVPEDTDSVAACILANVVIPGVKNAIADIVSIVLFGDSGRLGSRKSGSRVGYQKIYNDLRDDRKVYGHPRSATTFECDDIIFETYGDAALVLEQLEAAIANYEVTSVADLYDLAGITCQNYTANKYGWSDLRRAKIIHTREGYMLQLPRTEELH